MSANVSTTLEVIFKGGGASQLVSDIKNVGTASAQTEGMVTKTKSAVDKMSQGTTTLGGKLKTLGSGFEGIVANVGTFSLSVVNLMRQYRDLGDAQIAVDRANLKLSRSHEAQKKAVDALTKAENEHGKGSQEAAKATLDLKQANEDLALKTTLAGEAQERFGDIQQNFWLGLIPTVVSAGGTMMGVLSKLGGEQGFGGLINKFKGLGSIGSGAGIVGLTAALGPLGIAAAAAGAGMIAYNNAMEKSAAANKEFQIAKGVKTLADELDHLNKGFDALKLRPEKNPLDLFLSLSPGGGLWDVFVNEAKRAKTAQAELAAESDKLVAARQRLKSATDAYNVAQKTHQQTDDAAAKAELNAAQAEVKRLEVIEKTIPATEKLTGNYKALHGSEPQSLLDTMTKPFTGRSVFYQAAQDANVFVAETLKAAHDKDLQMFFKFLANPNPTAITTKALPAISQLDILGDAAAAWTLGMDPTGAMKWAEPWVSQQQRVAAEAAANAQKANQAWQQFVKNSTSNAQNSTQRILDAWHKLHPDKLLPVEKAANAADKLVTKFLASLGPLLQKGGAEFQSKIGQWVDKIPDMNPAAKKAFQPMIDFWKAHGKEAPADFKRSWDTFMNTWNPGVGVQMSKDMQGLGPVGKKGGVTLTVGIQQGIQSEAPKVVKAFNDIISMLKPLGGTLNQMFGDHPIGSIKINTQQANLDLNKFKNNLNGVKDKNVKATVKTTGQGPLDKAKNTIDSLRDKTVHVRVQTDYFGMPRLSSTPWLKHQSGFHGHVNQPTLFMAGERGRERVRIEPTMFDHGHTAGSGRGGGGGGTRTITRQPVIVNLDGRKIAEAVAEHIDYGIGGYTG